MKTKRAPEEVLARAERFFGPGGLGLAVQSREPRSLTFEGGGGVVTVTIRPEVSGSEVEIASREWDPQAQKFMRSLRRPHLPFL
ncbi:MAG: hypothetical protein M3Z66_11790 [Chloroflexota bacterium]|nr:hypothetical protein [Chloroflexota bacterium]